MCEPGEYIVNPPADRPTAASVSAVASDIRTPDTLADLSARMEGAAVDHRLIAALSARLDDWADALRDQAARS